MSMHCLSTNCSHHNAFRQVRAWKALTLFNNVLLRTRRALALYKVYGKLAVGPFWFLTEHHWTALAPFWFSTEHHWTVLVPFWLSADDFTSKLNFHQSNRWQLLILKTIFVSWLKLSHSHTHTHTHTHATAVLFRVLRAVHQLLWNPLRQVLRFIQPHEMFIKHWWRKSKHGCKDWYLKKIGIYKEEWRWYIIGVTRNMKRLCLLFSKSAICQDKWLLKVLNEGLAELKTIVGFTRIAVNFKFHPWFVTLS